MSSTPAQIAAIMAARDAMKIAPSSTATVGANSAASSRAVRSAASPRDGGAAPRLTSSPTADSMMDATDPGASSCSSSSSSSSSSSASFPAASSSSFSSSSSSPATPSLGSDVPEFAATASQPKKQPVMVSEAADGDGADDHDDDDDDDDNEGDDGDGSDEDKDEGGKTQMAPISLLPSRMADDVFVPRAGEKNKFTAKLGCGGVFKRKGVDVDVAFGRRVCMFGSDFTGTLLGTVTYKKVDNDDWTQSAVVFLKNNAAIFMLTDVSVFVEDEDKPGFGEKQGGVLRTEWAAVCDEFKQRDTLAMQHPVKKRLGRRQRAARKRVASVAALDASVAAMPKKRKKIANTKKKAAAVFGTKDDLPIRFASFLDTDAFANVPGDRKKQLNEKIGELFAEEVADMNDLMAKQMPQGRAGKQTLTAVRNAHRTAMSREKTRYMTLESRYSTQSATISGLRTAATERRALNAANKAEILALKADKAALQQAAERHERETNDKVVVAIAATALKLGKLKANYAALVEKQRNTFGKLQVAEAKVQAGKDMAAMFRPM